MVHAEAMLGGIAQAEHRFDDAGRASPARPTSPRRRASPARRRCTAPASAGCSRRAATRRPERSYARAIDEAVAGGDGRLAATARLHLARLLRAGGDDEAALGLLEQNARWFGRRAVATSPC